MPKLPGIRQDGTKLSERAGMVSEVGSKQRWDTEKNGKLFSKRKKHLKLFFFFLRKKSLACIG